MQKKLETERLILRPFTEKDADPYFVLTQDWHVKNFLSHASVEEFSEAERLVKSYERLANSDKDFVYVLEGKKLHQFVGCIYFIKRGTEWFITSIISKPFRGTGLSYEAIQGFHKAYPSKDLTLLVHKKNKYSLKSVAKMQAHEVHSPNKNFRKFRLYF